MSDETSPNNADGDACWTLACRSHHCPYPLPWNHIVYRYGTPHHRTCGKQLLSVTPPADGDT